MEEERVFTEHEQVPKKRADCVVTTATLPENTERNRFRDVVPYEENRVELVPNKENNTGYINASHIKVCTRIHGTTIKKHSPFSYPLYNPYDVFTFFSLDTLNLGCIQFAFGYRYHLNVHIKA